MSILGIKDDINKEEAPVLSSEETEEVREMIAAGVLFGRKKTRTHPKMAKFIFTNY